MQRPCAQLGKDARLAAGHGRTLASILPASAHRAGGRVETNPRKKLPNQPKTGFCQHGPTQASTSQYKSVQVNTTIENIFPADE